MTTNTPLRVNTRRLLINASLDRWYIACAKVLMRLADDVDPVAAPHELANRLPEHFDYATVRAQLSGRQLLGLVDALEPTDPVAARSGRVFLTLARTLYVPLLPGDHPGAAPTKHLLDTLAGYLDGTATAEDYIATAFKYRSQYGTTITSVGTDAEFEMLFEAMPSGGLCCPVGEGDWHLASSWRSFGRFLAQRDDRWRLLDCLEESLDYTPLVEGNAAASGEADDAVRVLFDEQREALAEGATDEYEDLLERLVDAAMAIEVPSAVAQGEATVRGAQDALNRVYEEADPPEEMAACPPAAPVSPQPSHAELVMFLYGQEAESAETPVQPDASAALKEWAEGRLKKLCDEDRPLNRSIRP